MGSTILSSAQRIIHNIPKRASMRPIRDLAHLLHASETLHMLVVQHHVDFAAQCIATSLLMPRVSTICFGGETHFVPRNARNGARSTSKGSYLCACCGWHTSVSMRV